MVEQQKARLKKLKSYPDNLDREFNGLVEAMRFFNHPQSTIAKVSDKDEIWKEGFNIKVNPAYEFLLD